MPGAGTGVGAEVDTGLVAGFGTGSMVARPANMTTFAIREVICFLDCFCLIPRSLITHRTFSRSLHLLDLLRQRFTIER